MITTGKTDREALGFFLDNGRMHGSVDCPDEGMDYVFMLEPDDWMRLTTEWDKRDDDWKTAMTCLAGNIDLQTSYPVLFKAISDSNPDIMEEGLLSVCQSLMENEDNYVFPAQDKQFILNRISLCRDHFDNYPELEELQDFLITQ